MTATEQLMNLERARCDLIEARKQLQNAQRNLVRSTDALRRILDTPVEGGELQPS